jgi:hypothetical protein
MLIDIRVQPALIEVELPAFRGNELNEARTRKVAQLAHRLGAASIRSGSPRSSSP